MKSPKSPSERVGSTGAGSERTSTPTARRKSPVPQSPSPLSFRPGRAPHLRAYDTRPAFSAVFTRSQCTCWCSLFDVTRRVGLVCGYLDRVRDGVADYSLRLAGSLEAPDLKPILLTTHSWAGVDDRAVGVAYRWNSFGILSAARAIRGLNLDILHVQFAPSVFGFSRAVGFLPLLLPGRIRLIVTLHEYGVWTAGGPGGFVRDLLWSAVERLGWMDRETWALVPHADGLLVPSAEQLEVLRARFGDRQPPALEVPIGLNIRIEPGLDAQARAGVRRDLGAPDDAPLVAFFGFFHPVKALDRLVAAVAAIRDAWPEVHLLLLGGVESHSVDAAVAQEILQQLDQVITETGMTERVHITGYLPDAEISRLFSATDVAALPFDDGVTSKSGSMLTAFALGVPVIATAPPGQISAPAEIDGLLRVPPRDTDALAQALRWVLGDPALAARLRATGLTFAAQRNWDAIAAVHRQIYAEALVHAEAPGTPDKAARDKRSQPWQSRRRPAREGKPMSLVERARSAVTTSVEAIRNRPPSPARSSDHRPTEDPALFRPLVYGDPARLHVAPTAVLNNALINLSSGDVTIGDYAFFGHNVSVLTGTHDWTKFGRERQVSVPDSGRDVIIEEGVWVSSNATIVGPCRIGAHSVVGVGSLVLKDVEPYTIVAGSPAKVLRTIPRPNEPEAKTTDPDAGPAGAVTAG
jgi:glycosyltransferase involved in cell wall biosynthesis/acetyltransferase-like isoleucine patch superfamily enzyme